MPHSPHLASVSSCEQATHSGGCGFCIGLGSTWRSGMLKYLPLCSLGPVLEHRDDGLHGLLEDLPLVLDGDAERLELGDRGTLAHAELATAARQQIEAGDTLGDPGRMVGGELQDPVAEPDLLGALAGGRQERLRRRRVGIFLEEMVLDFPCVVVAELVGQFELAERILVEPVLVALFPGSRQLQLIEDAELHALSFLNVAVKHARRCKGCK